MLGEGGDETAGEARLGELRHPIVFAQIAGASVKVFVHLNTYSSPLPVE